MLHVGGSYMQTCSPNIYLMCIVIVDSSYMQTLWKKPECVCARNYLPCKGGCICGFTSLNSKHTSFTLATELSVFTACMNNPMQSPWRLAILASYPGLLAPAFFTCSTNVGEGLVKQKDVPLLHTSRYGIARDSVLPGLPPP